MKKILLLSLIVTFSFFMANGAIGAEASFEGPAIATTCGQSPGALMVKLIAKKAGIECDQDDQLTADKLDGGKYKTLFVTMGSSGKGLGAAGTNIEKDCARATALIEKAHSLGMKVIGVQFEGMSRRTDKADDLTIDAVAPNADTLLVKEEGNADGRFTKIAESKNIPLHSVKQPMDIVPTLKEMFGK